MRALLSPLMLALLLQAAVTQPMRQAALPGGPVLELSPDPGAGREGWLLQRRAADGQPDTRYGQRGAASFTLGQDNEDPAVLRVDAQGRAWVAGGSEAAEGLRAVVLRFTADGLPDRRFAQNGRAALALGGRDARATDLLPLDDGGALVTGTATAADGSERPALWRLRDDGTPDARFGAGGAWLDGGRGDAEALALQRGADGSLAFGLRRHEGAQVTLEVWSWFEGAAPQRVSAMPADPQVPGTLALAWRDGQWHWDSGTQATAGGAPAAAEPAREAPVAALATPFSDRPAVAAPAAGTPTDGQPAAAGWWLLLPAGVGAWVWWRRRG